MTPDEIEKRLGSVCGEILSLGFWLRRDPDDKQRRERKRQLERERDELLAKRPKKRRRKA